MSENDAQRDAAERDKRDAAAQKLADHGAELVAAAIVGKAAAPDSPKGPTEVITAATGSVAALLALLSGIGLGGERLAVVLIGGPAKDLLIDSLWCAIGALGLGLLSVLLRKETVWGPVVAGLSVIALIASLILGVNAAGAAYSNGGRPGITKVELANIEEDPTRATLSFTVTAVGVRYNNLLRVSVGWVGDDTPTRPYLSTLRPDEEGVASQEVSVTLDRQSTDQIVRIAVFYEPEASSSPSAVVTRTEEASPSETATPSESVSPNEPGASRPRGRAALPNFVGVACGRSVPGEDPKRTVACVEVVVPAEVVATSSPTPPQ